MGTTEEENWCVECSDEELNETKTWEPEPEEIHKLYTMLADGQIPEIKWKFPGYRAPSPEVKEEPQNDADMKEQEQDDFDFMDEMTSPKLKIRNRGEETLKGSAKKRVTSLDGVINNMRRHHLLPPTSK